MSRIERRVAVAADAEAVWAVLADFGALSRWVPMIQHSCLLSEQVDGVGAVRRVQIARQTLVERVVEWSPAYRLAYDIDGLPPIVGVARNTWTLRRRAAGATEVVLETVIETGRNPVKAVIANKVLERMATASEMMLAGLQTAVTNAPTDSDEVTAPARGANR